VRQLNWDRFMCFLALFKAAAVVGPVWSDSESLLEKEAATATKP
jgi:hypothetical protein